MKTLWITLAVAAAVLIAVGIVSSQESSEHKAMPQGEGNWQEMMDQYQKMNMPGPEHDRFKKMVGSWTVDSKMWFEPGAEPVVSQGKAEIRLVLGGRYAEQTYECPMMGMPYKGMGFEGYDMIKKKYVSIWMDNMSTGIFYSEGTADQSGNVVTYVGYADDPITGEKNKAMKSIARVISDDQVIMEMYEKAPEAGEFMTMELTYTRKK